MKKILIIISSIQLMLMLTSCLIKGDCTHNFIYQGNINVNERMSSDNLVIRFENLGNIIFDVDNRKLADTTIVKDGGYKVIGDFLTACDSDKDIFNDKDSLSFEVLYKGKIIKSGKFCVENLSRQYIDSTYTTIIDLPLIKIK